MKIPDWSNELRHYLYQEIGWEWIYKANIYAKPELNLISITSDQTNQNIKIRINRKDKKANLIIDGKILDIFKVVDSYDSNHLSVEGKFKNLKKMINADLEYGTKLHLLELLFAIRNYDPQTFPELKNILFKDIKFKKTIDEMINILKIPS